MSPADPPPRRSLLTWPLRRWRPAKALALLVIVPWIWIRVADPAAVDVDLPALEEREWDVWVRAGDWHAAVTLPRPEGYRLGPAGDEEPRHIEYAFGDKGYYYEDGRGVGTVLMAALLPTSSVVYVRGRSNPPEESELCRRFRVDSDELRRLYVSLEQAILRERDGRRRPALPVNERYSGRFYDGRESYIFWHNCNGWLVDRMTAAGHADGSFGVIAGGQVHDRIR